jgi:hypothetical protein
MTVDSEQNVTCELWADGAGGLNLPVGPGDVISATLCLETNPQGTAARFGAVYFDDISTFTTSGPMSLTSGSAVTMVDEGGSTLAEPVALNDYAFKVV